jgi:hypothetical protein
VKVNSVNLEILVAGGIRLGALGPFLPVHHALETSFRLRLNICVMIVQQLRASPACDRSHCICIVNSLGKSTGVELPYLERNRPLALHEPTNSPREEKEDDGESILECDGEFPKLRDCEAKSLLFDQFQERTVSRRICTLENMSGMPSLNVVEHTGCNLPQAPEKYRRLHE